MGKTKKYLALTLAFLLAVTVTACGNSSISESTGEASTPTETDKTVNDKTESSSAVADTEGQTLVAYFAYSENMGDIVGMGTNAFLRLYPTLFSTFPFSFPDAGLQKSAWNR